MKYQLINKVTKKVYGTYINKKTARTKRNKIDSAYGSYICIMQEINENKEIIRNICF